MKKTGYQIKGFLFDVDGVLYDTMPLHEKAWKAAFLDMGIKVKTKSIYEGEGMPSPKMARYLASSVKKKLTQPQLNRIIQKKQALFSGYKNPPAIKGAKQLIRYLQNNKYKVGVVTGTTQPKTIKMIKTDFHITRDKIIDGSETKHSKPHPEPFLQGLKKLQLRPQEAMVVENAPLGIRSAKRAKIKCVTLTTGPISKKELKKEQPDWIFKDCAEVLANLEEILA